jgi:hypothetical protein
MGSDAALYYFDIEAYRAHVVPALRALMLGRMPPLWLPALIDATDYGGMDQRLAASFTVYPVDLDRCTYLDEDLACKDPGRFNPGLGDRPRNVAHVQYHAPDARRCAAEACDVRETCPFHKDNHPGRAELVSGLFQLAVSWICCKGPGVFVGRNATPGRYQETLKELYVPQDDPLRELLDRLGTRGFIIGYGWTDGDGVHGWLDPKECRELAVALWTLNLPAYPVTPENLARYTPLKARRTSWIDEYGWDRIVLAYVRAMAERAAEQGYGLLWANDLPTDAQRTFGAFSQWQATHG